MKEIQIEWFPVAPNPNPGGWFWRFEGETEWRGPYATEAYALKAAEEAVSDTLTSGGATAPPAPAVLRP